ncbi:MAG: hypothetical protein AB7S50_13440 [Bacteroidales bacterium]
MKKTNFLKIALTLVMAVAFVGVFGQAKDGNLTVNNGTAHTVTVNKAIPFYVTPDIYFNPNYTLGGGWVVTSTFLWNSDGTLAGTSHPVAGDATYSSTSVINPDITFPFVGAYVIGARESADCNGSIQLQTVTVIAAPSMDFGARADDLDNCGDLAAMDVLFDIDANTATTFWVDYTLTIDNLLADKVTLDANISTTPTADKVYAAAGDGLVLENRAFTVQNTKVTRYTYTLTGINDAVSRVSDYVAPNGRAWPIATFTNYAAGADDEFVIVVLPAPTTGPIFHLAN